MVLYPEVFQKAQAEIDRVIGQERLPDFTDTDSLTYLAAVIKEVLRWNPVTPLGSFPPSTSIRHEANFDTYTPNSTRTSVDGG